MEAVMGVRLEQSSSQWHFISHKTRLYSKEKGGGSTRNNDGSANGLGIGEPGAPANTLTAADRHAVAYAIDRAAFNQGMNAQYDISVQEETAQTLVARGPGGMPQDADGEERSNDDGEYG